jgi:hypothetical protein
MTELADTFIWALLSIGWFMGIITYWLFGKMFAFGHDVKEAFKDEHGGDY